MKDNSPNNNSSNETISIEKSLKEPIPYFEESLRLKDDEEFIKSFGSWEYPDPEKMYPETFK